MMEKTVLINCSPKKRLSVIFFLIYVFVWLSSHWLDKQDEKKINRALDEIRDSE